MVDQSSKTSAVKKSVPTQKAAAPAGSQKIDTGIAVEVQALKIPSVKKIEESLGTNSQSHLFVRFMTEIYPVLDLPKTTQYVLEAFSSRDVTAEKVSLALKENASIENVFFRIIESTGKRADTPSLEAAVVLIGMQNSRNLIVAMQLLRSVAVPLEWSKEGKLKTSASEQLKYALKTEEAAAGPGGVNAKEEYTDLAFSAGLIFDVFVLLASKSENKKKLLAYIEEIYNQSFKTATIAAEVVKEMPQFGFRRLFFAACLLHDVGKIGMAILDPKYLEFSELCAKKALPRHIRRFAEAKSFGLNQSLLGATTCYSVSLFSPFARAILYQHEPFLLGTRKKNLYQLAALVSLSTNIAAQFKKIDKVDDPIIGVWKGPELKDFKLDTANLLKAVSRVAK
jgi:HD-like signal output (HDOD) protein